MRRQLEIIHEPGWEEQVAANDLAKRRSSQTKRSIGLCAIAFAAILSSVTMARAQDSGSVPPSAPATTPANTPGAGPPPGAPQGGPPPLPVLLGYADFMLTLERPWQAEKLYKLVLMLDPKNEVAQKGLKEAENRQHIGFTALFHSYIDSKDVQLLGYGGGPVIMTPSGKITFTVGNGYYKNNNNKNNRHNPTSQLPTFPSGEDNFALNKQTYNLQYEPFWGKKMEHEGQVWLSYQTYDAVPDRMLYDVNYSYNPEPGRKKFTFGTGRKDSFYSNQLNQFLAPETYFQLKKKITFHDYYTSVAYPLGKQWDFGFNYRYFAYSDSNQRNNFRTQLLYRIKPTDAMHPMPIWRVGLDGVIDLGRFFTFDYGIPRDFRALSIATDYAVLKRDMKFIGYLSYPIAEKNFAAPAGLVGYASKSFGGENQYEFYAKATILQSRNLSTSLYDYVFGLNTRF